MHRILGSALLAVATITATAVAQAPAGRDTTRAAAGPSAADFTRITRDATPLTGYFDLYQKPGALYLAIPHHRLGQNFLMTHQISQGIGAAGLFGGTMLNIFESDVVALERRGDRVYLVKRQMHYRAQDAATNDAVRLSYGSSILESARVEGMREDSTLLINVHDWFVSDLSDVGSRVRGATSPRPGTPGRATLDRTRSYLEGVKVFPRNVNIRAMMTFAPGEPVNIREVPDSRFIPIGVAYTMAALPETPMTPRLGDDRMGYFMTVHKDFSSDSATFFVRYVNRWRLECAAAPVNGMCEARTPITYYIDRTVPVDLRPYMTAGVNAWNKAFERAGFRNAIRALPLPDDADPEDIRYPTLRWNTSDEPGYGAIGPSMVDPRTGEILDADILFEASMVQGFRNTWRTVVDPATAVAQVLGSTEADQASTAAGLETALFGANFAAQGALLRVFLATRGEIGPGDPVPMSYVGEALKWVTMHEVGHTLGLRHNFRSSADSPLDSLNSRGWAERNGLYSSAMEYPVPNISPAGRPNGYFYNPGVGSSDEWVIAYGYTPEAARASALAREAALAGHAYGTDEDAGGPAALDPSITPNDMSADPLGWAKQRTRLIADLMQRLPSATLRDNSARGDLTQAYRTLLNQYAGAASVAVKYVGGQWQYRDHVGDTGARAPLVPVPVEQQRDALGFLAADVFGPGAFVMSPELLQQFGLNRWSHWGLTNTVAGRIDYPLLDQALTVQTAILANLLHPVRLSRIRDAELRFGAAAVLPIPEVMTELTRSIWAEAWSGPSRSVIALRRDLQRSYLDRLVDFVARPALGTPADARASARAQLVTLDRRLATRLATRASVDAITAAHYDDSRARIKNALDAGLDVER